MIDSDTIRRLHAETEHALRERRWRVAANALAGAIIVLVWASFFFLLVWSTQQ